MIAAAENKWIEEYINYMRVGDFEKAIPLKEIYFPSSFYKYRRLSPNTLSCIDEGWLWMSEIDKLNDTFECSLLLDNNSLLKDLFTNPLYPKSLYNSWMRESEIDEIRKSNDPYKTYQEINLRKGLKIEMMSDEQLYRVRAAWKKDLWAANQFLRICSFSITNENIPMWAHYADNSKGICIEYELIDVDDIRPFLQPVYYSDIRSSVKSFKDINSYIHVTASICKSKVWEYEKEWRLTYFTKAQIEGKNNRLPVPTPKAIYLGLRFELNSEELKDEFWKIARDKNIPVFQMKEDDSHYILVPDEKPISNELNNNNR